jgi:hypothetical protein
MLAELLDARAALVQPRQRDQVMLLVVPLTANRDMGLDEPGVIDQTLAPAQIHVGLEGIKGEVADAFGQSRIVVAGAFHGPQHRDGGVLRRRGQVGVERPRRVVRYARLMHRRGRDVGGPAARAARGGDPSPPGCHAGWQRACAGIRPNIATTTTISPKDDAHRPAALRILV